MPHIIRSFIVFSPVRTDEKEEGGDWTLGEGKGESPSPPLPLLLSFYKAQTPQGIILECYFPTTKIRKQGRSDGTHIRDDTPQSDAAPVAAERSWQLVALWSPG